MAKNALARIKSVDKLRDTAITERRKSSALRAQLKDAEEELATVDWLGEAMAATATVGGAVVVGGLRGAGITDGREHFEPVAAVVLGFAAYKADMPLGLAFAAGLAGRWASEWAEDGVRATREALKSASTENATEKVSIKQPAEQAA